MVDDQRNRGAKIAGVQVFGSEDGSVRHIYPKRVIFHLTEDRAPTSPSSGNQRLKYSRQDYPQFRFRLRPIVHKHPTKKILLSENPCVSLAISFQFRIVEFVSVVESCCWFRFCLGRSSTAPSLCLFLPLYHPSSSRLQVVPLHYLTCPR
jgi:hypothetical protein